MTLECKCIDNEQRKLLLQTIGESILRHNTDIDIWKSDLRLEKFKDVAIPYYEEQIQKLLILEQKIREIPTCGPE
jgi:hypothetical protein